ncbi:MAG: DMT family transporter [Actinomycetota bacterium]
MQPEIFAVMASLFFAGSQILMKIGRRDTSVVAGLLVSLATGSAVSLTACLFTSRGDFDLSSALLFAVAGFFGTGIGRILTIMAVDRLGPSTSVPLQGSAYPVAAVLYGVLFLDENMRGAQVAGFAMILIGVWLLSRFEAAPPSSPSVTELSSEKRERKRFMRPGAALPLLAGLCYATSDIFQKDAVQTLDDPILGLTLGVLTGSSFWLVAALIHKPLRQKIEFGKGTKYFALSGFFGTAAILAVIRAFESGNLSVVTPITAAQPLPTLILSAIFLRGIERITPTIVVGAISVLLGTILISL